MTRLPRASLVLAATISLILPANSLAFSLPKIPTFGLGSAHAAPLKLAPGEWPQSRSDLKADATIHFGALPNGLRYAIRRQPVPAGQAALRLWVGAGSLEETDAQQGLAHFLEHMAFNGSKAVPEGDMIKILERLGLAFGADTNASTNFDETIYKLDLPRTDAETVDTSLMLLREAAGNLLIDQDAISRERGVVLSEERARDTPAYRVYKSRLEFLLPGQRPPSRYPIGKVDVIKSATAAEIGDFYRRHYRPDRAVLVAVGDFDPTEMEAKIRARFGDWKAEGPAGIDPDLGALKPRGTEAKLVVEPGSPLNLQIAWTRPSDLRPDSIAKRRDFIVHQLGMAVLNRRLSALSRGEQPPFLGAVAFKFDQSHSADVTMLSVNAEPDRWRQALTAVDAEQRRLVQYGVRQDELDREIAEIRVNLQSQVAGYATRRPAELAGDIVGDLSDQEVVTSPTDDLAQFEAAVKDLKADTVSDSLTKVVFQGQGPLVFMASPAPISGGEASLLSAYTTARKADVSAPTAPREVAWPYESFGDPGKVVETKDVTDLDTVMVRFENGVRLTIKPTRFQDDEVLVRVNVGDGMEDLANNRQSMAWAGAALIEGGLGKINNEDMERVLASKVFGARFSVGDDAFVLSGTTRPDDLATQMQVLTAYVADPGWRPEAFDRIKASGRTIHDQYEATDSGVLSRDLAGLLHNGDRRWTFPSRQEIARADLAELKAQVASHMASDPIEVVIVGDVTVEKATEAVAQTLGSLPPRRAPVPVPAEQKVVGFPAGSPQPLALEHKGRADQSIGYIAWPTTDYWNNPQRARDTSILGEVMGLRLIDDLREAQGVTYSPSVNYAHSMVWTGWGYLAASVEVPPGKLDDFFRDTRRIAADLRAKEPSADELERAKKPRIDRIEKAQLTNQYWLGELSGAQDDPRRLDAVRQLAPGLERVSGADVQRAAQMFLKDDKAFQLVVKPKGN